MLAGLGSGADGSLSCTCFESGDEWLHNPRFVERGCVFPALKLMVWGLHYAHLEQWSPGKSQTVSCEGTGDGGRAMYSRMLQGSMTASIRKISVQVSQKL